MTVLKRMDFPLAEAQTIGYPNRLMSTVQAKRPLILVSNDDGVYAEGIRVLAEAMAPLGRVVVVAPDQEQSAASHSLTLKRPLRILSVRKDVYAVDGTPTDAVTLAIRHILKNDRPDLVVSGINHGANLGDDVHYSGTVAAALEGALLGVPAIAFSLTAKENLIFDGAASVAQEIARMALHAQFPPRFVLNVNIPNCPKHALKGLRLTTQGKRNYGDIIVESVDPRGRPYFWIGGNDLAFEDIPGSDCNAIRENSVSITPIATTLTDTAAMAHVSEWLKREDIEKQALGARS